MSLVICFICAVSLIGAYSLFSSRIKFKEILILLATIGLGELLYYYIPFKIYVSNMVLINVLFINVFVALLISVVYFKDFYLLK